MTNLIKANEVSLVLGNKKILQEVSLTIQKGDFITIIGPNGAGKSMLLKSIIGLIEPDRGTIERKKNLSIGYVPQQLKVEYVLPLTAREFLSLKKNVDSVQLEKTIADTKIESVLDKALYALSSGEFQRVLLTNALLGAPDLLILDEFAQNLDITGQLELYALLDEIYQKAQGSASILMVSHDLHFVMSSTKQVVCLFHHICCSGAPQQVIQDPAFISLFGAKAQGLLTTYQHSHDHKH
jgi:zinc transport system ATP-binding protein